MKKLLFEKNKAIDFVDKKGVFNFLNFESLWQFNSNKLYAKAISGENNHTFPDGRLMGVALGVEQQRGPTFTRDFLTSEKAKGKKHFFIGNATVDELSKATGIDKSKLKSYNPPYVKVFEFPVAERTKMAKMIKNFKADAVWTCVGSPKQEILGNQLFDKYPASYFNVGAALDFLLKKKAEAPKFWRVLGLEWFYRGVTDFKHSWRKIIRSFKALGYLGNLSVKS